jgi:hypothetical protein
MPVGFARPYGLTKKRYNGSKNFPILFAHMLKLDNFIGEPLWLSGKVVKMRK